MIAVVCLDERLGMTFNGRRQSRDRVLCENVINDVAKKGGRLLMAEYSKMLFEGAKIPLICRDDFLDIAEEGDTCFVENRALISYADRINMLVVYRWNRHYPSDMTLDLDIEKCFGLISTEELVGSSHEKITKEIYVK